MSQPNRAAHHKLPTRIRDEERRHRVARLQRDPAGARRLCRWCGFVVYARGTDAHPQCLVHDSESQVPEATP